MTSETDSQKPLNLSRKACSILHACNHFCLGVLMMHMQWPRGSVHSTCCCCFGMPMLLQHEQFVANCSFMLFATAIHLIPVAVQGFTRSDCSDRTACVMNRYCKWQLFCSPTKTWLWWVLLPTRSWLFSSVVSSGPRQIRLGSVEAWGKVFVTKEALDLILCTW